MSDPALICVGAIVGIVVTAIVGVILFWIFLYKTFGGIGG